MIKEDFIKAGFSVVETENNENKLLKFLKENYPSVIKDNEINLQELKAILGLPIDEKVNGYGLNFVGRNFARAKYAKKTDKELRLNTKMSKRIRTTQNLVIKGDNLDVLKILKNYYNGKIKMIYIDPPYNTDSDEFVYPDKFDKEELEVLGLANLSEDDFARMEFSFKTKKSHNGWLSFMYPRLLLARDLLRNDGVIFISIDDNEVHNLRLLMDEIFGEENFVNMISLKTKVAGVSGSSLGKSLQNSTEYILFYSKNIDKFIINNTPFKKKELMSFIKEYEDIGKSWKYTSVLKKIDKGEYVKSIFDGKGAEIKIYKHTEFTIQSINRIAIDEFNGDLKKAYYTYIDNIFRTTNAQSSIRTKILENTQDIYSDIISIEYVPEKGKNEGQIKRIYYKDKIRNMITFLKDVVSVEGDVIYKLDISGNFWEDINYNNLISEAFDVPFSNGQKPLQLIKRLLHMFKFENDIILDFFAGSGTTGHAVMELNAEDGGNRKFILVQIDEPIKEDKPAYQFCIENNLPPVISSITIERLKRAGEKIKKEIEEENSKAGMFEENKKPVPDIGFKVFDTVEAPKLNVDETGQIQFPEIKIDPISRIYNMIFTIGLDEPTQVPEELVKDCIYKVGNNYYITNSDKISKEDFAKVINESSKSGGKVFIDGWTASLNATLQHFKEDVKIVF